MVLKHTRNSYAVEPSLLINGGFVYREVLLLVI